MVHTFGSAPMNTMPRSAGSSRTNISPCSSRAGVFATQTVNGWLAPLPLMVSVVCGNAARSSSGAPGACEWPVPAYRASMRPMAHSATSHRRVEFEFGFMVIRTPSQRSTSLLATGKLGAPGEIKAADEDAPRAGDGVGGLDTEATGLDTPGPQATLSRQLTLRERVDRALVITAGGEDAPAVEQDRQIGRQFASGSAFACRPDTEQEAHDLTVGSGSGKAHAQAAVIGPRLAPAGQLRVFPVQVQIQRTADPGAHIPRTIAEAGATP